MKKIGILHGKENTFPEALIARINSRDVPGIRAERLLIDKVIQGEPTDYAVIVDRISQDIPFYRAYLKNAALNGTAVINNPFWWSADEKFFNNCLATKIGVAVPKTVLLPSNQHPPDTDHNSMRNLAFPLDWETMFNYIGFPAFMKPHAGGGWKNVYEVKNVDEFFEVYNTTETLVMLFQEAIDFTHYFRCYCLGGKYVHIMPYDPRQPHHLRYIGASFNSPPELLERVHRDTLALNQALGYDFNTVEFAVRDGIPYAIDFCNPAPDADVHSVGEENFEWIVEKASDLCIEKALEHVPNQNNLTWGSFVRNYAQGTTL